MARPAKIFDSHVHLVTRVTQQARAREMAQLDPQLVRAYSERWQQSLGSRNEAGPEEVAGDVEAVAGRWGTELERAGVDCAVFFTSTETHDEVVRFVSLNPRRFAGYATFDPTHPGNAALLEELVRRGLRGLKLYPMGRFFRVNDPACFPVYEVCQTHRLPVVIHFGISISATHDLSYGNPLDLATPALRFPSVKWIIPHFGTGFFREALLLAGQYSNVCIDTSSSNNWVQYAPVRMSLTDLFRRTYEALGSKKIIFGSDSSFFPRGYRTNILEQQLEIFESLNLSQEEMDDIFWRNISES